MITTLALLLLFDGAAAAMPPDDAGYERFNIEATMTPAPPRSAEGRFEVQASARIGGWDDRRFVMKSLSASCSLADSIFSDGFESP